MRHCFRWDVLMVTVLSLLIIVPAVHVDAAMIQNRYTDSLLNLSVDVPEGWEKVEEAGKGMQGEFTHTFDEVIVPTAMKPGRFTIGVEDTKASPSDALHQQKEKMITLLQQGIPNVQIVREYTSCVAGADSTVFEFTMPTDEGKGGKGTLIVIVYDRHLYTMALLGEEQQWKIRYAPLLEKIIASLRFEKKATACKMEPVKAKFAQYTGDGFQLELPQGWVAGDATSLKEINDALTSLGFPLRAHALLSNPNYAKRAYILVVSDPKTKNKKGKVFDARGYAIESMKQSGVIPNAKEMKLLTMAGLKAVQWKLINPQTKKELLMTSVITKDDTAYSLYLESENGLYKKDKNLRNAYTALQKTLQLTAKGKSKK